MIVDAVRLGEVDEYSLRQLPPQLQQKILHAPYEQHWICGTPQASPLGQCAVLSHLSQHSLFAEPIRIKSRPKFKSIKFFIFKISEEKLVILSTDEIKF